MKQINAIKGNLLDIERGIICHQVNCLGKMGAGLALAIRRKYPTVYQAYIDAYKNRKLKLGRVLFVEVAPSLIVANLCGQHGYGSRGLYTNYSAIQECFSKVGKYAKKRQLPIYIPLGIGCGLAGGSWSVIYEFIENIIPEANIIWKQK